MVVNYVTNAPTSVNLLWKVAKNFVEDHTVKKIRINKAIATEEMAAHINPSQLEAKYGGSAPNAEVFWPPIVPSGPFAALGEDPEAYLSQKSSYEEYFPVEEALKVRIVKDNLPELTEVVQNEKWCVIHAQDTSSLAEPTLKLSRYVNSEEFEVAFKRNYKASLQANAQEEEVSKKPLRVSFEAGNSEADVNLIIEDSVDCLIVDSEKADKLLCCRGVFNRCTVF